MTATALSLANHLPLWCTVHQEGVTALITPALDYVGALEVTPLDARYASEGALATTGEALRSFVASLDDGTTLHFLYRVELNGAPDVAAYADVHAGETNAALREFVDARAAWLATQPLRRVRLFLFFSAGGHTILGPGHVNGLSKLFHPLGSAMPFAPIGKYARERHLARLGDLARLRNLLRVRLSQMEFGVRELSVEEVQALHFELLNPNRAAKGLPPTHLSVRENLWSEGTIAKEGEHLREYTEGEQLVAECLEECVGYLRQEDVFRRVMTLKVLPEDGTGYFEAKKLLELATKGDDGRPRPFAYWLAATVHIRAQAAAKRNLDIKHRLVSSLAQSLPFFQAPSVAKRSEDAAKQGGIEALFVELNAMSSKVVDFSLSVLLDAPSLLQLDDRTQEAKAAFDAAGNSKLLLEENSQLPAFLSVLPGSGPYQLRKKACTSRNAGDFLPMFAPWRGSARPVSLFTSPLGDSFRFDPFDRSLTPAHHGLVVADTGSGKSVTLGAITLDALGAGIDAILVDNGGSWAPMTRLLGGVHLPVDIRTPLTPFRPWKEMLDAEGNIDMEAIQDVVTFLELCVREEGERGFDKLTIQLVARAIRQAYEGHFRAAPDERPLMSSFRAALAKLGAAVTHPDDRAICENLHRRLGLFVGDELYGPFLDRPSTLNFDARLLTFDMAAVSKSPVTRSIAMAVVMTAITARAASRKKRTLVEVDEGHAYLGQDATAERFLERCYRVMRKYDVAMWMISQQFSDFAKAKSGDAIIGNSPLKIFLRHASGHEKVAEYFRFSTRATEAFGSLAMQPGRFSDFLLLYGSRFSTVRLALHPLAYWLLTTDGADKKVIDRAVERNPRMSQLDVLRHLARSHPHGASRPAAIAA